MSTYSALQSRIADDLDRTDLSSQIQQQIKQAIRHYKGQRLGFNETSTTLTATVSQNYVTAPTDLVEVDGLYITRNSYNELLLRRPLDEIIEGRRTSDATPTAYCLYAGKFELDCPSVSAYSMPLYYVKELTELSDGADSNGWTTDGEDLIVFHAEKKLYANVIKDQAKAAVAASQEREALTALRSLSMARTSRGYTKAHYL